MWSVELAGPTEKEKKDARSFSRRATAVTRPFFSIQFFSLSPKIETWIGIANLQISSSLFLYIYIYIVSFFDTDEILFRIRESDGVQR